MARPAGVLKCARVACQLPAITRHASSTVDKESAPLAANTMGQRDVAGVTAGPAGGCAQFDGLRVRPVWLSTARG